MISASPGILKLPPELLQIHTSRVIAAQQQQMFIEHIRGSEDLLKSAQQPTSTA